MAIERDGDGSIRVTVEVVVAGTLRQGARRQRFVTCHGDRHASPFDRDGRRSPGYPSFRRSGPQVVDDHRRCAGQVGRTPDPPDLVAGLGGEQGYRRPGGRPGKKGTMMTHGEPTVQHAVPVAIAPLCPCIDRTVVSFAMVSGTRPLAGERFDA